MKYLSILFCFDTWSCVGIYLVLIKCISQVLSYTLPCLAVFILLYLMNSTGNRSFLSNLLMCHASFLLYIHHKTFIVYFPSLLTKDTDFLGGTYHDTCCVCGTYERLISWAITRVTKRWISLNTAQNGQSLYKSTDSYLC